MEIAIRPAAAADRAVVAACIDAAFGPYVARIGKPPAPMLVDHGDLIRRGQVVVAELAGEIGGVLVCEPRPDHLFVEVLAVDPRHHRAGVGRRMMAFAEAEAERSGLAEVRLYTHEKMLEARAFYRALGYVETERRMEAGYTRAYLVRHLGTR